MKTALTIAGSDSGGGAGIQADLKTFAAHGVFGTSAVTALTAQNTLGVQGVFEVPPDFVGAQIDSVALDIGADAVKIGMISNAGIIEVVAAKLAEHSLFPLVLDPVMVAKGGDALLREDAKAALVRILLPLATVVTPNIPEAEALCGFAISGLDDMRRAARAILDLGPKAVVVKGGHLVAGDESVDIFFDGKEFSGAPGRPHRIEEHAWDGLQLLLRHSRRPGAGPAPRRSRALGQVLRHANHRRFGRSRDRTRARADESHGLTLEASPAFG